MTFFRLARHGGTSCHPSTGATEAGMSKIQSEPEPYGDEREREIERLAWGCEGWDSD